LEDEIQFTDSILSVPSVRPTASAQYSGIPSHWLIRNNRLHFCQTMGIEYYAIRIQYRDHSHLNETTSITSLQKHDTTRY
ncbi:hypothetical protein SFRURICE_004842, partial [Spodoptera frugiperda]